MFLFGIKQDERKYIPTTLEAGDIITYDEKTSVLTAKRPNQGVLMWYHPCSTSEKFKIFIEENDVRTVIELIASTFHLSFKEELTAEEGRVFVLMD